MNEALQRQTKSSVLSIFMTQVASFLHGCGKHALISNTQVALSLHGEHALIMQHLYNDFCNRFNNNNNNNNLIKLYGIIA